jgi:hypothetical protein
MEKISSFFKDKVFTSTNTLIFFLTMLSFIVALIVFFEEVLSKYPVLILKKKLDIVTIACQENPIVGTYIKEKVGNYFQNSENIKKVNEVSSKRKKDNLDTFMEQVFPFLVVISVIFFVYIIYGIVRKNFNLEGQDWILIFFAIFCFIVEIIFYIVILQQWEFISDSEFIKLLFIKQN